MEYEKIVSMIIFAELRNLFGLVDWSLKKIERNMENEKIVSMIIFAELQNLFGLVD